MKKENLVVGLFFFILGSIITLVAILLPKWMIFLSIVLLIIISYFIYDRYIVRYFKLEKVWWSPHIKKLNLNSLLEKEDFDPEIAILSYFIDKEYTRYQRIPTNKNKGFIIGGEKNKQTIVGKFLKEKGTLEVKFYPTISKNSILIMEDFKKFIQNFD